MALNGSLEKGKDKRSKEVGDLPTDIRSRLKRFKQLDVAYGRDNDLTS